MRISILLIMLISSMLCNNLNAQSLEIVFPKKSDCTISDIVVAQDSSLFVYEYKKLGNYQGEATVYRSTDKGKNWDDIFFREIKYKNYENIICISPKNKDTLLLLSAWGFAYFSFDGGNSWDISENLYKNVELTGIQKVFRQNNEIIASNSLHSLYFYSDDYGFNWEQVDLGDELGNKDVENIFFKGDGEFYAVKFSDSTYIYEYSQNKLRIKDVIDLYNPKAVAVYKEDQLIIADLKLRVLKDSVGSLHYLFSYYLYDMNKKETKRLLTVRPDNPDDINEFIPLIEQYDGNLLFAGFNKIWIFNEESNQWTSFNKAKTIIEDILSFFKSDLLDSGFGLFQDQNAVYLFDPITTSVEEKSIEDNTVSIYPNPSSGIFTLSSKEINLKKIQVFDTRGQEVGILDANSLVHDLSYLENGKYFLIMSYKDKITIGQLVISR